MKNLFIIISAAIILCAASFTAGAQVFNPISPSSNSIPVTYTNIVPSTPWFIGGAKQCTVYFNYNCYTNTGNTAGTGTKVFTIAGSPAPTGGTFYPYNTNGTCTVTDNGTNIVGNYITVDGTGFQQLEIWSEANTATNLVATNKNYSYLLK